jgi:hypothetical protein
MHGMNINNRIYCSAEQQGYSYFWSGMKNEVMVTSGMPRSVIEVHSCFVGSCWHFQNCRWVRRERNLVDSLSHSPVPPYCLFRFVLLYRNSHVLTSTRRFLSFFLSTPSFPLHCRPFPLKQNSLLSLYSPFFPNTPTSPGPFSDPYSGYIW